MKTIKEIYDFLNEYAPFDTALEFDNCGLLIGNFENKVSKVLLSLDITPEVIEEARQLNAQLIITHHPVIFKPISSIEFSSNVHLLSKYEINVICAHTNLDIAPKGVNFQLAKKLELENLTNLTLEENKPMGLVGFLKNEISCKDFALYVKEKLNCNGVRFTETNKPIKKIALCSGSGGCFVSEAKQCGADAFVTGEIKHSEILKANQLEVMIVDTGHYKNENVIIEPLKNLFQNRFPSIEFVISEKFTDKIKYI